ncbi:EamA family transporter [Vibrio mexicanus]|uniref:EamA family transporter n=1 Tax=Vibrio mexicanus TaxID=1004326 RepID=UPI000A8AF924|nr:EamA family transporter [Vibrio mexicanus]
MDAGTFSVVRLVSGVLVFVVLSLVWTKDSVQEQVDKKESGKNTRLTLISAAMLFAYAVLFSFAYTELDTGTGALVLFGSVQITMILMGVTQGHKLTVQEVIGVLISFGGLAYLMLPSMSQASTGLDDLTGYLLMTLSGVAWGVYSILGRGQLILSSKRP